MKKKFYLVTGGSGFIGAALVRRLVQNGHRVRVLDNQSRGKRARLADVSKRIEFIQADIRNKKAVEKAVQGVDGVCHLAFVNGTEFFYKMPDLVLDVGVKGIMNVIDACVKLKVKELIVASSSEVYQTPHQIPTDEGVPMTIPDPLNPRYSYAAGKILSEILALNFGRKFFERVIIFRPHNVYGPDMGQEHVLPQFVMRLKKLLSTKAEVIPFPIQGSGRETRSFIYIDDFIDGLMRVIEKGKHLQIYHIGTSEEIKIKDVAGLVAGYFGRKIKIIPGRKTAGSTDRRCPDITKLKKLGFTPRLFLKDGLPLLARWYDENA